MAKELEQLKVILKHKVGGISLPDFMTYYIPTVIKRAWDWSRDRHIDECNEETPQIDPHKQGQLIFDKVTKAIEKKIFSISDDKTIGCSCTQKRILYP